MTSAALRVNAGNVGTDAGTVNFDARLTRQVPARCLCFVKEIRPTSGSVLQRAKPVDRIAVQNAVRSLLDGLGFDVDDPALETTAEKTAEAFIEALTCGYDTDPATTLGSGFPVSGMIPVVATDIPLLFMCPHHLMPARGVGHVAFVASDRAPGLSRITRAFQALARRLVLQEDLTEQVAQLFFDGLGVRAVLVEIEARHTCVALEDFAQRDTLFVTRAHRGDPEKLAELQAFVTSARRR